MSIYMDPRFKRKEQATIVNQINILELTAEARDSFKVLNLLVQIYKWMPPLILEHAGSVSCARNQFP